MLFKRKYFKYKDLERMKIKQQKKMYPANTNQKKANGATLTADKTHFKPKRTVREKEGHLILAK